MEVAGGSRKVRRKMKGKEERRKDESAHLACQLVMIWKVIYHLILAKTHHNSLRGSVLHHLIVIVPARSNEILSDCHSACAFK